MLGVTFPLQFMLYLEFLVEFIFVLFVFLENFVQVLVVMQ